MNSDGAMWTQSLGANHWSHKMPPSVILSLKTEKSQQKKAVIISNEGYRVTQEGFVFLNNPMLHQIKTEHYECMYRTIQHLIKTSKAVMIKNTF